MIHSIELAWQLLLHPGNMANSLRDNPPLGISISFLMLILLGIGGVFTGLSSGTADKLTFGVTASVSVVALFLSSCSLLFFITHISARIVDGVGTFTGLFSIFLLYFESLFLFVGIPLIALTALFPTYIVFGKIITSFGVIFSTLFFVSTILILKGNYLLDTGRAIVVIFLNIMFVSIFMVTYYMTMLFMHKTPLH
jgi:hypothetical protein